MKRCCAILAIAVLFGSLRADPPATQPDDPPLGRIAGALRPADGVKAVRCIDRGYNLPYPVTRDAKTGRFVVDKVALGRRYDLEIDTTDGRTFRGVDLSFEEDELLRLARETDKEPAPEPGPLTDADRAEIKKLVTGVEAFMNEKEVLHLAGNHARATALVELRRTTPFHSGKGNEQIRRVEVWYFQFQYGGWEKAANAEKVLYRRRAPAKELAADAKRLVFVPALGGILVDDAHRVVRVDFDLPGYRIVAPTTAPDAEQAGESP